MRVVARHALELDLGGPVVVASDEERVLEAVAAVADPDAAFVEALEAGLLVRESGLDADEVAFTPENSIGIAQ